MNKKRSPISRGLALVGGLSWTLFICVVLGAFLGTFVDNTFRTRNVFLLVGTALGVIGGVWQCCRHVMKEIRKTE